MEVRRAAAQEKTSRAWWLDTNPNSKRSPWLIATLTELEEKTKEMLKLIEEDADSFAKRAEMYYEKRPELVSMIEDFYRAHRSLAERYDQLRVEGALRRTTSFDSSFLNKIWSPKVKSAVDKSSESSLDTFDYSEESEVDDPEPENEGESGLRELPNKKSDNDEEKWLNEVEKLKKETETLKAELAAKDGEKREVIRQLSMSVDILKEENHSLLKCMRDSKNCGGFLEFKKLNEEKLSNVEKLKKETETLKAELVAKDEEKREVIRQLSMSVDILKEENQSLWKCMRDSKKWGGFLEFKKLKNIITSGKLFSGLSRSKSTVVVAL